MSLTTPVASGLADARMNALLDRSPFAMAFVRDQSFGVVSAQLNQLFHCGDEDGLAGQTTRLVQATDTAHAGLHLRMQQAFAQQHPFEEELECLRRDGTRFWGRLQAMPLAWAEPEAEALWIVDDVTLARREREQPTWSSVHDGLTELLNRREFERRVAEHVGNRRHEPVAVLHIDIDDFAAVNTQLGTPGGDQALRQLAFLLKAKVRASDLVARLDADHYAVLLPACDAHWAEVIADKLRTAIGQCRLRWGDKRTRASASVGGVQISAAMRTAADVMAAAAAACADAQAGGGNAVCVVRPAAALPPG